MKEFIRKLQRTSGHSYSLVIPKELVQNFGWKEKQKLKIVFSGGKHDIVIKDWKPKKKIK